MIYQRHIPKGELIAAQLEMLLQNGQRATLGMHMVGVFATVLMFWTLMPLIPLVSWALVFLVLLLIRSLLMSSALRNRCYQSQSGRIYWQLILGAALTGSVWSFVYIFAAQHVPLTMQYVLLLLIVMVVGRLAAFLSASVTVVLVERIPPALYDIEMNASVTALVARLVVGADTADCGTFCHRRTPSLRAEARAAKTKTPRAFGAPRRRICRN